MKKEKVAKKPDAFTDSDKHVLHGTKLFPWTAEREIAANSLGMIYPRIGAKGFEQWKRLKTYPGVLRDMIVCLWLCTQNETEVDEAGDSPEEAYSKARKWAASLGIHKMDSDPYWQALAKFLEITKEVEDSITLPKVEPGEELDEGNE